MPSIRINAAIRAVLLKRIIAHGYDAQIAEFTKREHALALAAYNATFSTKLQKQMEDLPKHTVPETSRLEVYVDGEHLHLQLGKEVRIPYSHKHGYSTDRISFHSGIPLGAEIKKFIRERHEFSEKKTKTWESTKAVLESTTTLKKLLEIWPEVEAFTHDIGKAKSITALAVPIETLNRVIGLPPDQR